MDMKEQAEKFRRQVLDRGGVGPRTRYTAEQRVDGALAGREQWARTFSEGWSG